MQARSVKPGKRPYEFFAAAAYDQFMHDATHPLYGMEVRCEWCRDERCQCIVCWTSQWQLRPGLIGTFALVRVPVQERAA